MRTLLAALLVLAASALMAPSPGRAAEAVDAAAPKTIWRLLDYIGVDYRAAIENGQVISEAEYAEMIEFAGDAATRLRALPATPAKPSLLALAEELRAAIDAKASPDTVARTARSLADGLLAAYPFPLAPARPPALARGVALNAELCASCHGATGQGDGPLAQDLDPPPIAFTDVARADERSVLALYQVIEQGIDGTSMASFDHLTPEDRWALAFHVGRLAYSEAEAGQGQRLWESNAALRALIPDLEALSQLTPADLAAKINTADARADARAVMAFLRANPAAVDEMTGTPLAIARTRLAESFQAYQAGDRRAARDLALSAYLDGFEMHEVTLNLRDPDLVVRIEEAMIAYRSALQKGAAPDEARISMEQAGTLLETAERLLLADQQSVGASFIGAFTILLREGLEALLIVVAMLAFLAKTERKELAAYVHFGWGSALVAGVLTWFAATRLIAISGAGRELTEGIGALIAVVVLALVGIWMHGKSRADAWQRYIRERMSRALSKRSAWFLFLLSFIVVYREAFETILFYIALWTQGRPTEILLGAALGVLVLAVLAWALMRFSRELPAERLFLYSSFLIVVLAVILAGKGVAAFQEAGWLSITPASFLPRIAFLGIYPTWEGVGAQLAVLGFLVVAYRLNNRPAAPTPSEPG